LKEDATWKTWRRREDLREKASEGACGLNWFVRFDLVTSAKMVFWVVKTVMNIWLFKKRKDFLDELSNR
jgi:hypothetical protein